MTKQNIYNLAYTGALMIWDAAKKSLEEQPENEFFQAREKRAWTQLQEIEKELKALEG